jgi:hypothetical protein
MTRHVGKLAEIEVIACDWRRASRGERCSITVWEVNGQPLAIIDAPELDQELDQAPAAPKNS